MEILKHPHPLLSRKCHALRRVDAELLAMMDEMFAIMYRAKGVGLAANQVGIPYRFFIMNPSGDAEKPEEERVYMNPVVTLGAGKPVRDEEGCLSFPKVYAEVLRAPKVTIRAYDRAGKEIHEVHEGFAARIIQHEYDHLEGVSFVERLDGEDREEAEMDMVEVRRTHAELWVYGESFSEDESVKRWEEMVIRNA